MLSPSPVPPDTVYTRQPAPTPAPESCDICGTPRGTADLHPVEPDAMRELVANGYLPTTLRPDLRGGAQSVAELARIWQDHVTARTDPWHLCRPCAEEIDRVARGR